MVIIIKVFPKFIGCMVLTHWTLLTNCETNSQDPGGCFSKHNRLSDRVTDLHPMLSVHSRMVRHPVGRSVTLIETAP